VVVNHTGTYTVAYLGLIACTLASAAIAAAVLRR
jgi:hypothetical protein